MDQQLSTECFLLVQESFEFSLSKENNQFNFPIGTTTTFDTFSTISTPSIASVNISLVSSNFNSNTREFNLVFEKSATHVFKITVLHTRNTIFDNSFSLLAHTISYTAPTIVFDNFTSVSIYIF